MHSLSSHMSGQVSSVPAEGCPPRPTGGVPQCDPDTFLPGQFPENKSLLSDPCEASIRGLSYPDNINTPWGGYLADDEDEVEDLSFGDSAKIPKTRPVICVEGEETRCALCGRLLSHLVGRRSGHSYYKLKTCFRWFCPDCGKVRKEIAKTGRLHRRRCQNLLDKIGSLDHISLRQYVFTMPAELRVSFLDRDAILSFKRMCYKIVKTLHPGKPIIAYFHAFGDKVPGYNPHWNFHVLEPKNTVLRIDNLDQVKAMFRKSLIGYGCRGDWKINIFYSFAIETGRVLHRLRYMCRPHPNSKDVSYIRSKSELWDFFLVKMKGFDYITCYGDLSTFDISDGGETLAELEEKAGEPLRYDPYGTITYTQFKMMFQPCERVELSDGFYRIDEYTATLPAKLRKKPPLTAAESGQLDLHLSLHGITADDLPF